MVAAAVPLPSPVLQPCRTDSSREEVTKKEMLAQAMEFKQKEVALLEKMEGMQEEAMTAAKRAENALALKEEELAKTLVLLEHERTLIEQLKEDFQSQFRVRTDPAGPGRGRGRAGPGGEGEGTAPW